MTYIIPLISAICFFAIPTFVGWTTNTLLNKLLKVGISKNRYINFIEHFVMGSVVVYAFALISKYILGVWNFTYAFGTLLLCAIIASSITYAKARSQQEKSKVRFDWIMLIFIALSVLSYAIWKFDSPLYATLNWDLHEHQALSNIIQSGKFEFFTSKLSDTFQFDGYSTIFHLLLSIPQKIFSPNITAFWWFLQFFHLLLVTIASYLVGRTISNNRKVGIISALLGAFIFETSMAYTSLFLIPQNLSAVVGAVFIARIIYKYKKKEDLIDPLFVIFIVFITLSHLVIGTFITFLAVFSIAFLTISKKSGNKKLPAILLILSVAAMLASPFVTKYIDLDSINRGEAAFFNVGLLEKYNTMITVYGLLPAILLPIGIAHTLIKHKSPIRILTLIIAFGTLSIIVANIPYSLKFYSVARFFIHTIMAIGLWTLLKPLGKVTRTILIVVFVITLSAMSTINYTIYKQVPSYKNISTHISPFEVGAAKFLADNYKNTSTLLISEPSTMYILEALSGVNTPGGAYTTWETRQILSNIYYYQDAKTMTKKLNVITDGVEKMEPETILFAVGGRFGRWQKATEKDRLGIHWNAWRPKDLVPEDLERYNFIDFIKTKVGYNTVYENDGIVIFEVRKHLW